MPRPKSKVESALLAKGFQKTDKDHHYFIYFTTDGKKGKEGIEGGIEAL